MPISRFLSFKSSQLHCTLYAQAAVVNYFSYSCGSSAFLQVMSLNLQSEKQHHIIRCPAVEKIIGPYRTSTADANVSYHLIFFISTALLHRNVNCCSASELKTYTTSLNSQFCYLIIPEILIFLILVGDVNICRDICQLSQCHPKLNVNKLCMWYAVA